MKQIKLNSDVFLLVDVPEDAEKFMISHAQSDNDLVCFVNGFCKWIKTLEPGWEIVGKGTKITEDVWRGIVEKGKVDDVEGFNEYCEVWYSDYENPGITINDATESGHSWIKSHGMKPETTLILKLKN